MRTRISAKAASRIREMASMPVKEFKSEHKKLVKVLRAGDPAARRLEASKQSKELGDYA